MTKGSGKARELTEREKLAREVQAAKTKLEWQRDAVQAAEKGVEAAKADLRKAERALTAHDAAQQNAVPIRKTKTTVVRQVDGLPVMSFEDENQPRRPGQLPAVKP